MVPGRSRRPLSLLSAHIVSYQTYLSFYLSSSVFRLFSSFVRMVAFHHPHISTFGTIGVHTFGTPLYYSYLYLKVLAGSRNNRGGRGGRGSGRAVRIHSFSLPAPCPMAQLPLVLSFLFLFLYISVLKCSPWVHQSVRSYFPSSLPLGIPFCKSDVLLADQWRHVWRQHPLPGQSALERTRPCR